MLVAHAADGSCHCTDGAGEPVADTVKVTWAPSTAVTSAGSVTIQATVPAADRSPSCWSARKEATQASAEFQLIATSLVAYDSMSST